MAAIRIRRTTGIRRVDDPTAIGHTVALRESTPEEQRRTARRAADVGAAEHPHPLDDVDPKQAGRELAKDPLIRAGVAELLDALGLLPDGGTP